jgi:hypothetical protein
MWLQEAKLLVRRRHCSAPVDQGSALGQECFDHSRRFDRSRHHEQMSVVDQLEPGFWNEPRENAVVDWRHQRIVLLHQDQGRLPQRPDPRQTSPPRHCQKLEPIADMGLVRKRLWVSCDQVRVVSERAAVDFCRYASHVGAVDVAARCRELPDRRESARYHDCARRRCRQYQPSAHIVLLMGELLSNHTTP